MFCLMSVNHSATAPHRLPLVVIGGQPQDIRFLSDFEDFARLAGWRLSYPLWDAETLRARLTALRDWIDAQPEAGLPIPVASCRWAIRWPKIPRTHPLSSSMRAIRPRLSYALTLVDQGRLEEAQQTYREMVAVMEHLSARIVEPDAVRNAALASRVREGASTGGFRRSEAYAASRKLAENEAKRIWHQYPHLTIQAVARSVAAYLKTHSDGQMPTIPTIRSYIAKLAPHQQRPR
jgi:hypothetical protein